MNDDELQGLVSSHLDEAAVVLTAVQGDAKLLNSSCCHRNSNRSLLITQADNGPAFFFRMLFQSIIRVDGHGMADLI